MILRAQPAGPRRRPASGSQPSLAGQHEPGQPAQGPARAAEVVAQLDRERVRACLITGTDVLTLAAAPAPSRPVSGSRPVSSSRPVKGEHYSHVLCHPLG